MPGPESFLFVAVIPALKANVPYIETTSAFDVGSFHKVVLVGVVSDCPDYPCRCRFGFRLGAELDGPFASLVVDYLNLLGCAALRTSFKGELAIRVRRSISAPGAIKQVATLYIRGFRPKDRMTV